VTNESYSGLEAHAFAALFPLLEGDAFDALVEDIRTHGLRQPGLVWRGQLVDGRNRARACAAAGVEFRTVETDVDEDELLGLVVSHNLRRRQMTTGQRAELAVDLIPLCRPCAKERQREGARLTNRALGRDTDDEETLCSNLNEASVDALGWAAKVVGVSRTAVFEARRLRKVASPVVLDAVKTGTTSLNSATTIAKVYEPAEQAAKLAGHREEVVRETLEGVPPDAAEEVLKRKRGDIDREAHRRTAAEAREHQAKQRIEAAAEERKATRERNREAKLAAQAEAAEAAAPDLDGLDLRLCDVADLFGDPALQGAATLIHADPPWLYDQAGANGNAQSHYVGLSCEQIAQHVDAAYDLALSDAYLLLWLTGPKLREWFAAAEAQGLRWRQLSAGHWVKSGIGVGQHWRGDGELLVLYKKGSAAPRHRSLSNTYRSDRTRDHSEKPQEWLRQLLEAFAPERGLVVDLYAGLAPLARACHQTGHRYVGAEIDPKRHGPAQSRLQLYVANTPRDNDDDGQVA
jgi:N6-adenosine-specific RNA methylase IME4